jgi:hypothetical protein
LAAVASLLVPGLGQLLQGRWILAGAFFVATMLGTLCCVLPGIGFYIWSVVDAARWKAPCS